MCLIWICLAYPSVVYWKESVPWLVAMSVWANFSAHFAAYQGSRAEEQDQDGD